MAPWAGLEPATERLTAACSTTELPGNVEECITYFHIKATGKFY
jgi:hypothetical protein